MCRAVRTPTALLSALALLTSLSATAQPAAQPKRKVAVLALQAESGLSQGAANLLTELITTDLSKSEQYEVLSSADIATLLGFERQRQLAGCKEDDSCFAEIGSALGVDLLVTGSVGALGKVRVLTIRAYDAKKSRPFGRETTTVDDEAKLVDATRATAAKLFGLVTPASVTPEPVVAKAAPRGPSAGWFVLGGAALLAVGGLTLGLLANGDYERFKQQPFDDALGDAAKGKALAADVLFGTALATGIVSVVLLVLQKPDAATALWSTPPSGPLAWEVQP